MTQWKMTTCLDSFSGKPVIEDVFDSPERWREWLRRNYPDIIRSPLGGFVADGETTKQYGTNNRWSSLIKVEEGIP